jgi:hypothetical protein
MQRMPLLSTEAINYQSTQTFKELELAFRDIMFQAGREFDSQKRRNEELLEAIVKNAFNINCSVEIGELPPCMMIFDEYHNSVLVRNNYREWYSAQLNFTKRFIGGSGGRTSMIDINTAKTSGLFSELPFTIYLPIDQLKKGWFSTEDGSGLADKHRFSSEEMAAVFLHEVGHFFTYCETFCRTVTTNMALAAMTKALDGAYSVDQRHLIIAKCVDDLKLKDVDVAAIAATDKKSIIETAIVFETAEKSRSELGISIYDSTASEFLADQFATRHGAGRHLMTALNKLTAIYGDDYAHMSQPWFIFCQIVSIALMFIPPISLLAIPINVIGILLGGFGDDGDNTYDTPEVRFRRIKQDTINRLKNRNISADEKKRIVTDVEAMEKAMEGIKDKREWREYIATTLIPVYRRNRKTKMLQQQLEQLGNNPLFVRSAELAVLL